MTRISDTQSRAIFGNPGPPSQVSEYQFDGFDDQLAKLAQTPWDKIPDEDLWYYLHDLVYMELQPDLFAYLFPVCLNFWYHTLLRNEDCAVGDAEFHYSLFHGQILEKRVTPSQREQILTFFHDGFLDCIDEERGFIYQSSSTPAYGWITRFNSLGLFTPLVERLWTSWWRMDSSGQAVSALIYLSSLMYGKGENPIFKPKRKKDIIDGPYLWRNDSQIFDSGWLPENLAFFRRTLTVDYLGQKAREASERLANEPEAEMANRIYTDYARLAQDVEIRIEYLIERLEAPHDNHYDW